MKEEKAHVPGDAGELASELHTVVSRFGDFSVSKSGLFVNSGVKFCLCLAPDMVCSGRVMALSLSAPLLLVVSVLIITME